MATPVLLLGDVFRSQVLLSATRRAVSLKPGIDQRFLNFYRFLARLTVRSGLLSLVLLLLRLLQVAHVFIVLVCFAGVRTTLLLQLDLFFRHIPCVVVGLRLSGVLLLLFLFVLLIRELDLLLLLLVLL